MQRDVTLGSNRTGIKASPLDAGELLELQSEAASVPVSLADTTAEELRIDYHDEADAIGSMPPPASLKGVFGTVKEALSGHRLHILLDKLGERAAYERSGTRLYDAALLKLAGHNLPAGMDLAQVREIRDEEARHFMMLVESIEALGGDPSAQTPCANMTAVQSQGLLQALGDPRITLPQILQTLLAAELIDGASWELLIELCNGFGLEEMAERFTTALAAENRHLANVRAWLSAVVGESALGHA